MKILDLWQIISYYNKSMNTQFDYQAPILRIDQLTCEKKLKISLY